MGDRAPERERIELVTLRARSALTPGDLQGRRTLGRPISTALRAMARDVERCLPELCSFVRWSSRVDARVLSVGWSVAEVSADKRERKAGRRARLAIEAVPEGLAVCWGYRSGESGVGSHENTLVTQAKRARADVLAAELAALRAEGAVLVAGGEEHPLAEEEWLAKVDGELRFVMDASDWREGEVAVRWCAERAAKLLVLANKIAGWNIDPMVHHAVDARERRDAVRSLRWDERAFGRGAAPKGLVIAHDAFVYDPATGWFAPTEFTVALPACAAHAALLSLFHGRTTTAQWERDEAWCTLGESPAVRARLARWLAARGAQRAERDAAAAKVFVRRDDAFELDGDPALDAIVKRILDDPSGDSAVAIAGLLAGVPWVAGETDDPVNIAALVRPKFAANAARGMTRLREVGLLRRGADGHLGRVEECLDDPATRPVIVLAIEHALGSLEVLPARSGVRAERNAARGWELGAGLTTPSTLESLARRLWSYVSSHGLDVPLDAVRAFVVSLRVRRFTVLAGVSGTGKSRFAALFARFVTEGELSTSGRWAMVAVRPDWLDPRGLLGTVNPDGRYEITAALRVILAAREAPERAHVLVLDELNLARVEYYLAGVLSAIESGEPIALHNRTPSVATADGRSRVPAELVFPPNVFVIGTVNVDETTHPLSTKVLDRVWYWEFSPVVPSALLRAWVGAPRSVNAATEGEIRALIGSGRDVDPTRELVLAMGRDGVGARIDAVFAALSDHGKPFGHRVAREVLHFVSLCEHEGIDTPPAWWLDRALMGKILPRLSGSRRELEPLLRALVPIFTGLTESAVKSSSAFALAQPREPAYRARSTVLAASLTKVQELLSRFEREPYVSFSR